MNKQQQGTAAGRNTKIAPKAKSRRRAARVVRGKENREMARDHPDAFWTPLGKTLAPPLRTTFGNFSTLNLVERFTFTTSTVDDIILLASHLPMALACMRFDVTGQIMNNCFGPLASSTPLATRPLRLGVEIRNLTTALNVSGIVQAMSTDNAINISATTGALEDTQAVLTNSSFTSLKSLVAGSLDTRTYTGCELTEGHSFTSVPSSWPKYNSYSDFVPMYNASSNSLMRSPDWLSMVDTDRPPLYPGIVTDDADDTLGDVPGLRHILLVFKSTPTAQTYEVTIRRQDGARYASNTLGHMFHRTAQRASEKQESKMLDTVQDKSKDPSSGMATNILSTLVKTAEIAFNNEFGGAAGVLQKISPMVVSGGASLLQSYMRGPKFV